MDLNPDILRVENLTKYFGGLAAVSNCSLKIKQGSITGIIGPNGSKVLSKNQRLVKFMMVKL